MMTDDGRTAGRAGGRTGGRTAGRASGRGPGARRRARRVRELACRSGAVLPIRETASPGQGGASCAEGAPLLEVEVTHVRGTTALAEVRGEIDLQTADLLRTRLTALHAEGHRRLVADFAGVLFCDAAGLGALVAVYNLVSAAGGELRLARVRPAQRRLLRVTGLDRVLPLHEDVEDALAGGSAPATSPLA